MTTSLNISGGEIGLLNQILAAIGGEGQLTPQYTGTPRYVSPNGNDTTGLSWATAYYSINTAMAACSPRDVIFLEGGYTYDEDATLNGLVCNVDQILIESIGPDRAIISNTDTTNDGAACTITARGITLKYIRIRKGETASTGAASLRFNGGGSTSNRAYNCIVQVGNAATHVGAHFTGGCGGCIILGDDNSMSAVAGVGVGTAVHFDNAVRCGISNSGIGVTTTGVSFDSATGGRPLLCSASDDSLIQNCTTGISLTAGASLNILSSRILAVTTPISDLSGSATNLRAGSFTALARDVEHIPQFTGEIWFVSKSGIDTNEGKSPDTAFLTIGAAISAAAIGDMIKIRAGTYTDDSLDLNLDGLELWGEIGTHIEPAGATTGLVVSGDHCRVNGVHVEKAGQTGIQVTGDGCEIVNCHSTGATAYDITGDDNTFRDCIAHPSTVSGYDISGEENKFFNCQTTGNGGATRGFYLSGAGADKNILVMCGSIANGTAGFEVVSGANRNKIMFSTSGGGDGNTIDDGFENDWPGYVDQLDTEHHEDIYPLSAGQGAAGDPVAVSNLTTDGGGGTRSDQNYWGDVVRIIPPDTLTARWRNLGIYIHSTTASDIQQYEILFTYASVVSAQNGGNDWDENETVLTVVDGSLFEDDDLIWIAGTDRAEGEILKVSGAPAGNVVTIARETTADAEAGLRYDYDVAPGNNEMYLVKRDGVPLYEGYEGDFSAANARSHARYIWHAAKQLAPNGGMLIRMLNATDGGNSTFDVRAIYED